MPAPKLSLKGRALRYLSIREHSRLELARKLSKYVQEGEDLKAVLDWLEASKFLSEERFTESLIHRRAARFGNNRILSELQSHGIDAGKLGTLKSDLADDETSRAREVWRRRFGEPPADAAERAKQMKFLQQRGFSHRAIQAVMRHPESDPDAEE